MNVTDQLEVFDRRSFAIRIDTQLLDEFGSLFFH